MKTTLFDALKLVKMASGHKCLNLTEHVAWEAFPEFAERVFQMIGGRVVQKSDGVEMRLWQVNVRGCALRCVFDDYPLMVSLESSDDEGDLLLANLHHELCNRSV